jgi:hypothetical protein
LPEGGDAARKTILNTYRSQRASAPFMIDVREEIANAPIGRYHRFLALLIGMVVFFGEFLPAAIGICRAVLRRRRE